MQTLDRESEKRARKEGEGGVTYRIVMHDILMTEMVGWPIEILRRRAYPGLHPAHPAVGRLGARVRAVGGVGRDGV